MPKHFDILSVARARSSASSSASSSPRTLSEPAQIPGIVEAICDLSSLFYDIMTAKKADGSESEAADESSGLGGPEERAMILVRIQDWERDLPLDFGAKNNFAFQSCFLE